MTYADFLTKTRFANLDGIRFLSILAVMWHHARPNSVAGIEVLDRGFLGVDFFFVLSGFLITTLLLRERRRTGTIALRGFYLKRALRILPVYLFVVGFVSAIYILAKGEGQYLRVLPYYLLFLNNFLTEHIPMLEITWSLAVEEHFYAVWPVFLVLVPSRFWLPLVGLAIGVNVAGIMGVFGAGPAVGALRFALPNATYAPIIMGAGLVVLLDRDAGYARISRAVSGRYAAVVCMAALMGAIALAPLDLRGLPNLLIHSLMTLTLAALVVREDCPGLRWLQAPVVVRVGMVSYGIYLYHLIGLDLTGRVLGTLGVGSDWALLVCYALISFAMAEVSFRTLEAYFRRFRPKAG
jgi:peptidoglycan/LPS O-acetylase OafA/YrhL